MPLVVETGFGIIGAESYASVAEADAYWGQRGGNPAWAAASQEAKEGALRLASEHIDMFHLSGRPAFVDGQGLAFPFEDEPITLSTITAVKRATIKLAPIALGGPLHGDAEEPVVLQATDKLGDISESRTYAAPDRSRHMVRGQDISFLGQMLSGLRGGGLVIGRRHLG